MSAPLPVAMSIAGSDSGAGAGIQADLLTFAAIGVYGTTAITCLTAQNPDGVSAVEPAPADFLKEQVEQVARFYPIGAIKTGMVFNAEIAKTIGAFLADHPEIPCVIDPVMVASSGAQLLEDASIEVIKTEMLPRAALITPNLDEARMLTGTAINTPDDMRGSAKALCDHYGCAVLLKGGHLQGNQLLDVLVLPTGTSIELSCQRIETIDTHGSGCTLSSAIAAYLAKGFSLQAAVEAAHNWLQKAMQDPLLIGQRAFINHAP